MKWTDEAERLLRSIRLQYEVSETRIQQLRRITEDWTTRRIADDDQHGYDDNPRAVTVSDVAYSWAYMQVCEMEA